MKGEGVKGVELFKSVTAAFPPVYAAFVKSIVILRAKSGLDLGMVKERVGKGRGGEGREGKGWEGMGRGGKGNGEGGKLLSKILYLRVVVTLVEGSREKKSIGINK